MKKLTEEEQEALHWLITMFGESAEINEEMRKTLLKKLDL